MRKNYLFATTAAIAALTLTACSEDSFTQDDLVRAAEEQAGDAVRFGTYLGTPGTTRAGAKGAIADNTALQGVSFGVFAYQHGTTNWASVTDANKKANFMYNQKVTYSAPSWTYSPVKYWPNGKDAANPAGSPSNSATDGGDQMLSFFAYAPYVYVSTSGTKNGKEMQNNSGTSAEYDKLTDSSQEGTNGVGITNLTANNVTGNPEVTYKLPTTPILSSTVDLLWGTNGKATYNETDNSNPDVVEIGTGYNVNLTKQIVSEDVKFLFKHALAQIENIEVVYDIDGNGQGAQGFGTTDANTLVTINSVTIQAADATSVYQDGTFDISAGNWTGGSTKYAADASLISGETINAAVKEATPKNDGTGWKNSSDAAFKGVTVEAKDLYSTYSPIMFIPVPGNQPKLKVGVTYVVRTYDANLDATTASGESNNGKWTKVTQTITNNVTLPELSPNKKYTLVMHLGLTKVKFSAAVEDWDSEATKSEVWLPSNVVGESTSLTIAAGGSATVNTAASTTSYVINLTGLKASTNVTEVTYSGTATAASQTTSTDAEGNGAITVTLPANADTESKSSTITIKGKKTDDSDFTTTVTIIQAKA